MVGTLIGSVAVALCGWNAPGANPTTSSVPATLAAMGINSPALARKIAAGAYDELITFHRNDRRAYGMTSGNAKWCAGEIDTSRWADDYAEQGRVYRVAGVPAVVWYWHCGNLSLWTAPAVDAGSLAGPTYLDGADLRTGGPIGSGPGYAYAIPLAPAIAAPGGYGESWGAAAGFGFAIDYVMACACCGVDVAPAVPVPEPGICALIVVGVGFVFAAARKGSTWHR